MIELYLDGNKVALPWGFQIPYTEENPYITNNGEYTLDVEINLLYKGNARIFKNINRFNVDKEYVFASAILKVHRATKFNGSAVVISIDDKRASIQLLSGNSEFNFICNDEKMLSEIDFGSETGPITQELAIASFGGLWPDNNYVCARNRIGSFFYNALTCEYNEGLEVYQWKTKPGNRYNIQPYLMYYIDKLITELGFTKGASCLDEDDLMCRIIIFSKTVSLDYNDLLPDITVRNFIEEIEKFCNVRFIVDSKSKSISIVRNTEYYSTAEEQLISVDDIADEYQAENIEITHGKDLYKNIKYNHDDKLYFDYQRLSSSILKMAAIVDYATYDALLAAFNTNELRATQYGTLALFHTVDSDNYYMVELEGTDYFFDRKNIFADRSEGTGVDDYLELNIVPVEMDQEYYAATDNTVTNKTEITNLKTLIEDNAELDTAEKDTKIRIGIQRGYIFDEIPPGEDYFNVAITDTYKVSKVTDTEEEMWEDCPYSLRFNGTYGLYDRYYSDKLGINGAVKWIVRFKRKEPIVISQYFMIKNKRFICEKIDYTGDNSIKVKYVTGYFYEKV